MADLPSFNGHSCTIFVLCRSAVRSCLVRNRKIWLAGDILVREREVYEMVSKREVFLV